MLNASRAMPRRGWLRPALRGLFAQGLSGRLYIGTFAGDRLASR